LHALKNMPISFPGLFPNWEFNPDPIAIHIGHGIYWYGIILAVAMLLGLFLAMKQSKHYGLTEETITDFILWAVPVCIIGARLYYVLFYLDLYRNADGSLNFGKMIAMWDGGLAIYGAVIAGILLTLVFTKVKKIRFGAMVDNVILGLILGQVIGRWANFINREAFGGLTDLPWRMRLWVSQYEPIEVHPTFFYESMWNLVGLLLLLFVVSRRRRFDGENTCFYFLWYGMGRFWIEGLRSDSLYLFDLTFMGEPVRVSQALSLLMVVAAVCVLIWNVGVRKRTAEGLLVNQLAAEAEAERIAAEAAAAAEEADMIAAAKKELEEKDMVNGAADWISGEQASELTETAAETDTEKTEKN